MFPNLTNLANASFMNCYKPKQADFSNVIGIGREVFWVYTGPLAERGLTRLRISDKLDRIDYNFCSGHRNLKQVEFVTDKEDWVQYWNSQPHLVGWGGTLQDTGESDPDEATIATLPSNDGVYWKNTDFIRLQKVVRVKRTQSND